MQNTKIIFVLVFITAFSINCKNSAKPLESIPQAKVVNHLGQPLPYDLFNPLQRFTLARDLREISGLTYSPIADHLLAINDEKAYIYFLDLLTMKIQRRIDFGKSNDYEGIAYHDGMIYIVVSNGDIVVVDEKSEKRIDKYNTRLSRKNDIEGITFNPETTSFLVAAKGQGMVNANSDKEKSIFNLDPITKTISEDPFANIDLQKAIEGLDTLNQSEAALLTNYQISRVNKFSPSGIAVHPISKDIYILSSRGKLLVTINQSQNLKGVYFLDEQLYAQPEGICFGPDLTLYISNEGRAGKGKVYSFPYVE